MSNVVLEDNDARDGYACQECGYLVDGEDVELSYRLYECGECGREFVSDYSNRCENCNKFSAKVGDIGCPECECGELLECKVRDVDGELTLVAEPE